MEGARGRAQLKGIGGRQRQLRATAAAAHTPGANLALRCAPVAIAVPVAYAPVPVSSVCVWCRKACVCVPTTAAVGWRLCNQADVRCRRPPKKGHPVTRARAQKLEQ